MKTYKTKKEIEKEMVDGVLHINEHMTIDLEALSKEPESTPEVENIILFLNNVTQ